MVAILEVSQPSPTPSNLGRDSLGASQANRVWKTFKPICIGSSVWDRQIRPFLILPRKEHSVRYHGQIQCVHHCCLIVGTDSFKKESPTTSWGFLFYGELIYHKFLRLTILFCWILEKIFKLYKKGTKNIFNLYTFIKF